MKIPLVVLCRCKFNKPDDSRLKKITMTSSSNFYARTLYELSELLTRLLGARQSGWFVIEILISRDCYTCNKIKPNCTNINHEKKKKRQHNSNYVAHKPGAKRYGPVPSAHQLNSARPLPIRSNEHIGIFFFFFNQRQTLPGVVRGKRGRKNRDDCLVSVVLDGMNLNEVSQRINRSDI